MTLLMYTMSLRKINALGLYEISWFLWQPIMTIHITKMHLFLEQFVLPLSGPIEQIYTHNKMSYAFNVGLIIPLDTSFPNGFVPHF